MARIALGRGCVAPICLLFAAALCLFGAARPVTQGARTAGALEQPTGAALAESAGTAVPERERSLSGEPFFHMEILSVRGHSREIVIETTGALYRLTDRGMTLTRRIDPRTNQVDPRRVARLSFDRSIGPLRVLSASKRSCVVRSLRLQFEFNSDSLFLVSSLSRRPFAYDHVSLIEDAPWNKTGLMETAGGGREPDFLNRIWTDGYGGSLHAYTKGTVAALWHTKTRTRVSLGPDGGMAHMVFPPRFFHFEALYGARAKPLTWFVLGHGGSAREELESILTQAANPSSQFRTNPYGYFLLGNALYTGTPCPIDATPSRTCDHLLPVPIDHPVASVGYRYSDTDFIKESINELHALGFKVLAYVFPRFPAAHRADRSYFARDQPMEATLAWMKDFQREFDLDGYYLDYAGYGELQQDNWFATYRFIRAIREQVGDKGYLFHHDSVDVWGAYSGLRAIMIDAYCNAQFVGETTDETLPDNGSVDNPDEKYLRFYASGYGLAQAFGLQKQLTNQTDALGPLERARVMPDNLNGIERDSVALLPIYKEAYRARKGAYLSGAFDPDVRFPPDWYARISELEVQVLSAGTLEIRWMTDEPTDCSVAFTSDGKWWDVQHPTRLKNEIVDHCDKPLSASHVVVVEGLTPGVPYEFRIRSSNRQSGLAERIFGSVVAFVP